MDRQDAKDAKGLVEPEGGLDSCVYRVIGAALEVHRALGPGYLESMYESALAFELSLRGLPHQRQVPIDVTYKGQPIGTHRLDLLVGGALVVELKAVEALLPVHHAQVIAYLKATRCHLGLLINFNAPQLRQGLHRIVLTQ